MAGSAAFARIRAEVLAATCAVPAGSVTTYGAIGTALDVMARHVAYILATLTEVEREQVPWHRVTGEGGQLSRGRDPERQRLQILLLRAEGVACSDRGQVEGR